jgi:hypothetical protein
VLLAGLEPGRIAGDFVQGGEVSTDARPVAFPLLGVSGPCAPCQEPALANVSSANDGEEIAVPVGYEIDITLQAIGPNDYDTNVVLSSDAAMVLEITIAAGAPAFTITLDIS